MRAKLIKEENYYYTSSLEFHYELFDEMAKDVVPFEEVKIGMSIKLNEYDQYRVVAKGRYEDVMDYDPNQEIDYSKYGISLQSIHEDPDQLLLQRHIAMKDLRSNHVFVDLYHPQGVFILKENI